MRCDDDAGADRERAKAAKDPAPYRGLPHDAARRKLRAVRCSDGSALSEGLGQRLQHALPIRRLRAKRRPAGVDERPSIRSQVGHFIVSLSAGHRAGRGPR